MSEIERECGFNVSDISNCCKGLIKKSHNYIWRYVDECCRTENIAPYKKPKAYNAKQINQHNLNGEHIKTWESIADIERVCGYNDNCIWRCCKGKRKTAYGFIWKYADEETKKAA